MQTERYVLTIGVSPGYNHRNEAAADEDATIRSLCETAIRFAGEAEEKTGAYPSFVAIPGRVGYRHEWGCPEGGEFVYVLTGDRNPAHCYDAEAYRAAWRHLAASLKAEQAAGCR